jgi:hypothetical protein
MEMSKAVVLSVMWVSVAAATCFGVWLTASPYCLWAFVFALIATVELAK